MDTLLYVFASAFAIATLAWFSIWAFWIHPPEGWLGKMTVTAVPLPEINQVRHAKWFRWLKIMTIGLGLITASLIGALVQAHIA